MDSDNPDMYEYIKLRKLSIFDSRKGDSWGLGLHIRHVAVILMRFCLPVPISKGYRKWLSVSPSTLSVIRWNAVVLWCLYEGRITGTKRLASETKSRYSEC